ncbi:MAG: hypothetical protein AB1413_09375 [Thermodesulfobacteriota bacterium]
MYDHSPPCLLFSGGNSNPDAGKDQPLNRRRDQLFYFFESIHFFYSDAFAAGCCRKIPLPTVKKPAEKGGRKMVFFFIIIEFFAVFIYPFVTFPGVA